MINLLFLYLYNFIRISILKLVYGKRCKIHFCERFHPTVRIRLRGRSSVRIAPNLEIAKDGELLCFDDANLSIGHHCYFNGRLMISCHNEVVIGNNCLFGPDVKIFDNNHKFSRDNGVSTDLSTAPIRIGNNCWIASNVVILKGSVIGDNCVIGAGCVVRGREIPPNSIVKLNNECIEVIPLR